MCKYIVNAAKVIQGWKLHILTDGIFETGAYRVPSKSQNPIISGQGGPSNTQCSNPFWVAADAVWMVAGACPGRNLNNGY